MKLGAPVAAGAPFAGGLLVVAYFGFALVFFTRTGLRHRNAWRRLGDNHIGTRCCGWRAGISALFARIDHGPSLVVLLKIWPVRTRRGKLGACGRIRVGLYGKCGRRQKQCTA